jgi:hypothetical protein
MRPSFGVDFREHLARYLAEEIQLSAFWDWFMRRTWEASDDVDQSTAALAYDVQLLLFEFSDGLWTELELRDRLRALVTDYHTTLTSSGDPQAPTVRTGSSVTISMVRGWVADLRSLAGGQSATASG